MQSRGSGVRFHEDAGRSGLMPLAPSKLNFIKKKEKNFSLSLFFIAVKQQN